MQIIFIGGGNMAEAIFAKLEQLKLDIIVVQRNMEKRTRLAIKYPFIRCISVLDFTPEEDDILVLAVKPQDAKQACSALPDIRCTIVSVMAGVSIGTINRWLNNPKIARVMANTPALIGSGATGIHFSPEVENAHKKIIKSIFSTIGKNYILKDENAVDKMTAIAASAPAYLFYFAESMIDVAIKQFQFSEAKAKAITLQVLKGSIDMIENNPELSIKQLRTQVTSKNGTTEQAINVFIRANLPEIIKQAEIACYNRAKELGNNISKE